MRVYSNADMHYTRIVHCGTGGRRDLQPQALYQGRGRCGGRSPPRWTRITESREATQPVKSGTGGSTFKNPLRGPTGVAATRSMRRDAVDWKIGAAQVSELALRNFLINQGGASAADIETLGRNRAAARQG